MEQRLPIEEAFVRELERTGRLGNGADRDARLLATFLASDFHATAVGSLPPTIKGMMKCIVPGRHLLQIDEIVNIAAPLKTRFEEKGKDRVLKLHVTDGKQQLVAVEYKNIPDLRVLTPAGTKILVTDAFVHRGILMLCPENVQVLGGSVPRLVKAQEAARDALMKEPRPGKGRQNIGKLYEEAELAAWNFTEGQSAQQASPSRSAPIRTNQQLPPRPLPAPRGTTHVNKENTRPPPPQPPKPPETKPIISQKPQEKPREATPEQPSRQMREQRRQNREQCITEETIVIVDSPVKCPPPPASTFDVIDLLDDE